MPFVQIQGIQPLQATLAGIGGTFHTLPDGGGKCRFRALGRQPGLQAIRQRIESPLVGELEQFETLRHSQIRAAGI